MDEEKTYVIISENSRKRLEVEIAPGTGKEYGERLEAIRETQRILLNKGGLEEIGGDLWNEIYSFKGKRASWTNRRKMPELARKISRYQGQEGAQ